MRFFFMWFFLRDRVIREEKRFEMALLGTPLKLSFIVMRADLSLEFEDLNFQK